MATLRKLRHRTFLHAESPPRAEVPVGLISAKVWKVPRLVNSTPDPCCEAHEWLFIPLRGGTGFLAHAAFFPLRAHAAKKMNSQDGLLAAIRCALNERPLWLAPACHSNSTA